jgi:hypothetical protein
MRGWLDLMLSDLARSRGSGVVGARLLFEDGTIQHDGMTFERLRPSPTGPSPCTPARACARRPRPGAGAGRGGDGRLHGAAADLARELSGFDESYVIGDFEDTDLCACALAAKGAALRDGAAAPMFHLERSPR